jgi:phage gpG-like protein|tara:strand:- start:100 stop:525 length:426 start_codon:yes stop_codon:yes gene_type:complete
MKVEMNFDLKRIRLDLSKELNLAAQIIRKDHTDRLNNGVGVNGSKMKALKTGQTAPILIDTGKMKNLVASKATKKNQVVTINPGVKQTYPGTNVTMSDVGGFHQSGAGNLPRREWFGITKEVEKNILQMVDARISQEIRRA